MKIDERLRKNIRRLKGYSSARSENGKQNDQIIYLDANESPFENGLNRYPDPGQSAIRDLLSISLGVKAEKLFMGNGSDEILDLLFRIFCEPGKDNVLVFPPTYGMYEVLANVNDIKVKESPLNEDFSLNFEKTTTILDKNTKLIFLCSPNNPTGNSFSVQDVKRLKKRSDAFIVIDEAYIDFSSKDSLIKAFNNDPQIIVIQTFSKSKSAAGIRLGYAIADERIVNVLNKVKLPYNVSQLSQNAALNLLYGREKIVQNISEILRLKYILQEGLITLPNVIKIYPSDTNFLLVKFRNAELVYQHLLDSGIVVRDRSKELHCRNCLRITVGSLEQNNLLIKSLREYVREKDIVFG